MNGIELDDGSVVVGSTGCVLKLTATGKLAPNFGDHGIFRLPADSDYGDSAIVQPADNGFYVNANQHLLFRLNDNGSPDTSFGDLGRVDVNAIAGGPVLGFGALPLAGGGSYLQVDALNADNFIAKLTPQGHLDTSFSGDGIMPSDVSGFTVDNAGRILTTTRPGPTPGIVAVTRLLPDWSTDMSFGTDGTAVVHDPQCTSACGTGGGIQIGQDSHLAILGSTSFSAGQKGGNSKTFWATLGPNGEPGDTISPENRQPGSAVEEMPDGDLILAGGYVYGEDIPFRIGRINRDGTGGFSDGSTYSTFHVSPDVNPRFGTVTYNEVTGHLLAIGSVTGNGYGDDWHGVVTKVDATTGDPVDSFGTGGAAIPFPNKCRYGESNRSSRYGPWKRCFLAPPNVGTRVKIRHGNSRRPAIVARVSTSGLPDDPGYLPQKITFRLPKEVRIARGHAKSRISVKSLNETIGTFRAKAGGKAVNIRYSPTELPYDRETGEIAPFNPRVALKITLPRGTVRSIPKVDRHRKLLFSTTATVFPDTKTAAPWFSPNLNRLERRVRPVSGTKRAKGSR